MDKDPESSTDPLRPQAAVDRIGGLCELGVQQGGVDGAGVSMLSADGNPDPVYSTDELSALIEDLQFTLGEGPCFDAKTNRAPVLISDLAAREEGLAQRWPIFLEEAVRAGVRAVFAFPLGIGASSLGTLDLYRSSPGPLDDNQLSQTLSTADALGIALLDKRSPDIDSGEYAWQRMTVHQAAGMVMMQMEGSIEDALLRLRATAYSEDRSINDVAADVVDGHRRFAKEQT
jgi:GAF domain